MQNPKHPYRVFISYSHSNKPEMLKIVKVLTQIGLIPIWDKQLMPYAGFSDLIKLYIEHAQIFLPLISKASNDRAWVEQEIGYACALSIPVIPVALGTNLPEGMLFATQAVVLDEKAGNARAKLTAHMFDTAFLETFATPRPMYECAEEITGRAIKMAEYSNKLADLKHFGMVRQKGDLTSFNIPNCDPDLPVFMERYDDFPRPPFHRKMLREERKALERHAEKEGFKLIIDTQSLELGKHRPRSCLVRLQTLLQFLQEDWCKGVDAQAIALRREDQSRDSVTIVGDWFSAESVSAATGMGYRQTIFTRNGPEVLKKVQQFDEGFDDLLKRHGILRQESLAHAIQYLKSLKQRIESTIQ
jgi:hypothetical protein